MKTNRNTKTLFACIFTLLSSLSLFANTADWPELSSLLDASAGTWTSHPTDLAGESKQPTAQGFSGGALLGNGSLGAVVGSTSSAQTFYLKRNDGYWNGTAGKIELTKVSGSSASDSVAYKQNIKEAQIESTVVLSGVPVKTKSWILSHSSAQEDLMVIEITNHKTSGSIQLKASLSATNTDLNEQANAGRGSGGAGSTVWVWKQSKSSPSSTDILSKSAIATTVFGATATSVSGSALTFTIPQNGTVYLVSSVKGALGREGDGNPSSSAYSEMKSSTHYKDAAVTRLSQLNQSSIATLRTAHQAWWKNYWLKSYMNYNDISLNKFYFGSLYLLASANRGEEAPAGLWGPFYARDKAQWGGGVYANYNFQSTYYGVHTANRSELASSAHKMIVEVCYSDRQKVAAKNGYDGVSIQRVLRAYDSYGGDTAPYFKGNVGDIANRNNKTPVVSTETRFADKANLDHELRITAWLANSMLRQYYMTYDATSRDTVYEFIRDASNFYYDYLDDTKKNGQYYVWDSSVTEQSASKAQNVVPLSELDDHSLPDVAFIKYLMRGAILMAEDKGVDSAARANWQDLHDNLAPFPTGNYDNGSGSSVFCFREADVLHYHGQVINHIGNSIHAGAITGPMYPAAEVNDVDTLGGHDLLTIAKNSIDAVAHFTKGAPYGSSAKHTFDGGNNNFPVIWPAVARIGYPNVYNDFKAQVAAKLRNNLTIYQGGGGIETCGAIDTLHELALQSHQRLSTYSGNAADKYKSVIELFPGIPASKSVKFKRLRAEGGFEVSAEYNSGTVVRDFEVTSTAGKPCTILHPWQSAGQPLKVQTSAGANIATTKLTKNGRDYYTFPTVAGTTYVISDGITSGNFTPVISSLVANPPTGNFPLPVTFTATATDSDGPNSLTYKWDLDGNGSYETTGTSTATTTFSSAGTFTVGVQVSDGTDAAEEDVQVIVTTKPIVTPVSADLVVHYKFDENTGASLEDTSNNSYDGTIDGFSWVPGKFEKAVKLTSGKVVVPPTVFDKISDQMTFMMWVYDDGTAPTDPNDQVLFYGEKSGETHYYQVGIWGGTLYFQSAGKQINKALSTGEFDGAWNHWTFVRDTTAQTMSIYKNGVEVSKGTGIIGSLVAPDTIWLGKRTNGSNKLTGSIDDFRIYSKALSEAEVQSIMTGAVANTAPTASITAPSTGTTVSSGVAVNFIGSGNDTEDGTLSAGSLVWTSNLDGQIGTGTTFSKVLTDGTHTITLTATDSEGITGDATASITVTGTVAPPAGPAPLVWYKLDETSGAVAKDSSGNNYDGTVINTPTWQASGGKFLGFYTPNGSHIEVPATAFNNISSAATVSVWIKGTISQSQIYCGSITNVAADIGRFRALSARVGPPTGTETNKYYIEAGSNGNQYSYRGLSDSTNEPDPSQWEHWVVVTDSANDKLELYRNGTKINSRTQDRSVAGIISFTLGRGNYGGFKGSIDDFRLFDKALTAAEITAVMNNSGVVASNYSDWETRENLNGNAAGETADSDADGIENLVEYALNMDPTVKNSTPIEITSPTASTLDVQFPLNTAATDVTVVLQGCSDLVTAQWSPINTTASGTAHPSPNTEWRKATINSSTEDTYFLQIKVTK